MHYTLCVAELLVILVLHSCFINLISMEVYVFPFKSSLASIVTYRLSTCIQYWRISSYNQLRQLLCSTAIVYILHMHKLHILY